MLRRINKPSVLREWDYASRTEARDRDPPVNCSDLNGDSGEAPKAEWPEREPVLLDSVPNLTGAVLAR